MARHSVSALLRWGLLVMGALLCCSGGVGAESIHTSHANLRAGPGPNERIITALPQGESVTVLAIQGHYAKVRVDRTGLGGWVYAPAQGWSRAASPASAPQPRDTAAAVPLPLAASPQALPTSPPVPESPLPGPTPHPPLPATVDVVQAKAPPPPAEAGIMDAVEALPRARGPWTYEIQGGRPDRIPVSEVRLEMDPLDASVLFQKQPYDHSSFPVHLVDETGRHGGKVAVKGSFSRHFLKKSLLITLDQGPASQGRRRIALNAMATDPSQSREWLAWDLIHKLGMVAPKAQFTRLYINGEFIGLYLDIEWMDEAMFQRLGLGAGGELFEPESSGYCGDLTPASMERGEICWRKVAPRGRDLAFLGEMVVSLNAAPTAQFDAWLEQHFDAQSVIDWLVINTLTQNGDTYNKNYFLHRSGTDGKWRVIPWDYDLAWGRVADPALPFPRQVYNSFFQYAFPPDLGVENPLKRKVLENPRLYARFLARLQQVMTPAAGDATPASGWFAPRRFRQLLADLAALTRSTRPLEKYPVPGAEHAEATLEALAFFNEWRAHLLQATLMEKTVFGNPRWTLLPFGATPALSPEALRQRRNQVMDLSASADLLLRHARHPLVEPLLGWPLGVVTLREADAPVRLTLENAREQGPKRLPPGVQPGRCIERTWFATVKSEAPATLDLEFDYLHESSTRREVPDGLDESLLRLHWYDGQAWREPPQHVNGIANLLAVPNLRLMPDVVHRFVACQGPKPEVQPRQLELP